MKKYRFKIITLAICLLTVLTLNGWADGPPPPSVQSNWDYEDCRRDCLRDANRQCNLELQLSSYGPTGGWDYEHFQECVDQYFIPCRDDCVATHTPHRRYLFEPLPQ